MTQNTAPIQGTPAPTAEASVATVPVARKGPVGMVGGFVWGVFRNAFNAVTGYRFTTRPRFKLEETVVYSVHRSFFLWAVIFFGFFSSTIVRHYPNHAEAWTWAYIWVVFYTLMMLLFDVSTLKLCFWSIIFAFVWVTSKYLEDVKHLSVLSGLFHHFHGLHPVMSGGVASVLSWLLLGPWIKSIVNSFRVGRKSFSPNGIEERMLFEGKEITDRSGLHFVTRYRDLLETVLGFGAGDLEAVDSTGKVIKRWENIIGLFFIWPRLDEILHQRSAVVDNADSDPVEAEVVRGNV